VEAVAALRADDWKRLNRLLERALELAPERRAAWLGSQADLEQPLRTVLQSLLARAEQEEAIAGDDDAARWGPAGERKDDLVGPYRLEREIARGGMGVVWLARRADGAFDRQVALKLPRAEWAAPGLARRMARERAILASLAHPHIAQLYDAGWSADGRPYLALEYVDGVPIDAWCRARRSTVRDTVRLFVDVARAVAFAHTRLVVHRDLKPSNVLVTVDGTVKLLDFGIAKLLAGDEATGEETELTRVGGRALTLAYAAPEQVLGRPVSAATDVYALGVLLYELLAGARPYRPDATASDLERAIVEEAPPPPSRRSGHDAAALRGDLDTIVLKALKKAPEQRYDSAAAFAVDLQRYLEHQPIAARPDSRAYRTRMFVLRNRLPIVVASALIGTVLVGALISLWQADAAREEARRAGRIKEFVLSMIRQADPNASAAMRDADLALLAAAEQRIAKEMAGEPDTVMDLRLAIAEAYANRGFPDRARSALRTAIDDGKRTLAKDDARLARARIQMADNFVLGGDDVLKELDLAIETARGLGAGHRRLLVHGLLNRSRWRPAQDDLLEANELAVKSLGAGDPLTLQVAAAIAWPNTLRVDKARIIEEAYLAGRVNPSVGDAHPSQLLVQVLHAYYVAKAGRIDAAVTLIRTAIETAKAHHGEGGPTEHVYAAAQLAFFAARDLAASSEAAREALRLAVARQPRGEGLVDLRTTNFVISMIEARRVAGADDLLEHHRAAGHLPPEMRDVASLFGGYLRSWLLLLQGRTLEAEPGLKAFVELSEAKGLQRMYAPHVAWGWALRENGRPVDAIAALQQVSVDELVWDYSREAALTQLAAAYLALGEGAKALEYSARTIAGKDPIEPFMPTEADAFVVHGRALHAVGRAQEAVASLAVAHRFWSSFDPATAWAAEASYWYGRALMTSGETARGQELVRASVPVLAKSPMPSHRASAAAWDR
jgi:serine/threonine-protein kinase